jgi:hypothetical protein
MFGPEKNIAVIYETVEECDKLREFQVSGKKRETSDIT